MRTIISACLVAATLAVPSIASAGPLHRIFHHPHHRHVIIVHHHHMR